MLRAPNSERTARNFRRRRAFTFLEVLVVLVILGILASVAAVRFGNSIAHQRVQAAARRVADDLNFARRHALLTSSEVQVVFNLSGGRYRFVGMDDPDFPGQEYMVELTEMPYEVQLLNANFNEGVTISFDGYGMPASSGSVVLACGDHAAGVSLDGETGRAAVTDAPAVDADAADAD